MRDYKLFAVEISNTIYVLAEDERGAEEIAEMESREWAETCAYCAYEVTHKTTWIDKDWCNALPFTEDRMGEHPPDKTVRQLFEEMKEAERNRQRTPTELEAEGQQRLLLEGE